MNIDSSAMFLRLLSKKWLYWDINVHTEKNWDLSSVVRNMHSLIEHLNKNTPKKSLDFIVMPIVYAKCICHDAVLTFPCAWVTIKRKRKKISYFCVRPINDNSIFFLYYPIYLTLKTLSFQKFIFLYWIFGKIDFGKSWVCVSSCLFTLFVLNIVFISDR